jgi:hypothetical protein
MIRSRHQPSNEEVPNGPARDPDRDTGSAARPRSRRASARWVQATTPASPSLPLIRKSAARRSLTSIIDQHRPGLLHPGRWLLLEAVPTSLRRRFVVSGQNGCAARSAKRLGARYVKGHSENGRKTDASAIRSDLRFDQRSWTPGSPSKRSKQRDGHPAARPPSGDRPTCPSRLPRRRLSLQGRSDRLAPTRRVLRILGSEPRRDSRPGRDTGPDVAHRPRHRLVGLSSTEVRQRSSTT